MQQLLNLTTDAQGASVVSARELYEALGFDLSQWSRWHKKNIQRNPFAQEGQDWQGFDVMSNGNPTVDYALTTDFAERLCMLARTEQGEQVRRWFQAIKNKALHLHQQNSNSLDKPTTELVLQQGHLLSEQQQAIALLRQQVDQLLAGQRPTRTQKQPSLCRQSVIRRVTRYAALSSASTKEVYTWLYGRLQQVYDIDLRTLPRMAGDSLLDVAERHDHLHRILGLIEAELSYIED